jgi:hypothetical protein
MYNRLSRHPFPLLLQNLPILSKHICLGGQPTKLHAGSTDKRNRIVVKRLMIYVDNIDGVIALISGVSNRVQTLDNSPREVSGVLSELEKILSEFSMFVAV